MQEQTKRIIPFRNAHYGEICNDFAYLLAKACTEELSLPEEHAIAMIKNIDPRASYQTVYRTLFSVASYAATVVGRGTSMMWFNIRAKNLTIKMREKRFEFQLWFADGEGHLLAFPSKENEKYFKWI